MRPILLTLPLSILTALYLFFVAHFIFFRAEYHFGTEVGGVLYRSPWHYLGLNLIFVVIGILAAFAPKVNALSKHPSLARVIAIAVMVGGLIWSTGSVK
jgi:hypothetical protein